MLVGGKASQALDHGCLTFDTSTTVSNMVLNVGHVKQKPKVSWNYITIFCIHVLLGKMLTASL
jgi:hypothetical protein